MPLSSLKKIPVGEINPGCKLNYSVFNKAGQLVLRKGRTISSLKQFRFINTKGYFKENLLSSSADYDDFSKEGDKEIILLINSWIKKLLVIRGNYHQPSVDFTHLVLELALHIQLQCKRDLDILLVAMQIKIHKDFNVINALHSAVICEAIAAQYGLAQIERLSLIAGALTHDIGFEKLQNKLHAQPGKLSKEQKEAVEQHPIVSESILKKQGVKDAVWLDVVRHHHERLDGTGYPDKLTAGEISLAVKIIAIADTYVAASHNTVFRPNTSSNKAIKTIYNNKKSFDETLIYPFIKMMGVYPLGSIVRLQNKEIALVTNLNNTLSSPLVTVLQNSTVFLETEVVVRDTAFAEYKVVGTEPLKKYPHLQPQIKHLLL
ncbi:HD domain-containing phosphohydrolase [Thalassomonas sp. RHCl1]|uniref:HD-GYP domain-containing protein n=1 Tax=Thalassomonas sp. RHCl1 TaxID=2995320 RepID=UPI00248AFC59|nr:HD domain-containing phosphohydrolase [Thalassomonas sp. RHCl1]